MSQQPNMEKCLTHKVLKRATCFLLMGAIFFAVNAFSQSAQLVKGGSVGNRVYLEIVNDSHKPVLDVSIRRKKIPSFVTNVKIRPEHIARIGAGKKIRAEVTFDIKRKPGKHSPQPLEFTLQSENGQFSDTTPELLLQLEKQKKHVLPVDSKKTANQKTGKYVYVLTEVEVQDKPYSSGKQTRQIEHIPGQLGYTIKDFTPVYKKVTQLRCIDCPTEITLGKSIHFKFDLRTRYDSEKYQCEEKKSYDRWPPGLRFISSTGDLEAIAKGKPLHMPSCQELGLKGHETQNDPNSRVITAEDNVYDPVGLTLDERVYLTTDIRFTGDATDRDSVFYNDPAFSYTAEYTSDGKLFKEFRETKFTVEYDNRLLKTPDHLKENRIQFSINGMSLTYTLQVNGVPKSIAVTESTRASAFDEPSLNTIQVAGTTGKIDGRRTAKDTEIRQTSDKKLPTKRPEPEGKRQKKPIVSTAVDPHQPDTAVLIKKWLQRAKPLENANGARLRFDKWGRKYGTAANGGIITLNNSPDNLVSSIPEVHVWAHRHSLDSINLCKLEEYVLAQLNGNSLDHCKKSPKKKIASIPDVTGMSKKQAEERLKSSGLKTKVTLGTPASSVKNSLKVEKTIPDIGAAVRRGATVTLVIHTPFVDIRSVPELRGDKATKVIKKIKEAGLTPKIKIVQATSANQTGTIRSLDPPVGAKLKAGATVHVNIFGPFVKTITVPDVTGYTEKGARSKLASLGLKLDIVKNKVTEDRLLAGTVQKQVPEAGTTVKEGKTIKLVVYKQAMPDCSGLPGSEPFRDAKTGETGCKCKDNYVIRADKSGCDEKKETLPPPLVVEKDVINNKPICNSYHKRLNRLVQQQQQLSSKMMRSGNADTYACHALKIARETLLVVEKARASRCKINGNPEQSAKLMTQVYSQMCEEKSPDSAAPKELPYINIPSTLFGYKFDSVYVGGQQINFRGGRLQRPANGFLAGGIRQVALYYAPPSYDKASRTNQFLRAFIEWHEIGNGRGLNPNNNWCLSSDRDVKVAREGRKEFTISLKGYNKKAVTIRIWGYMRPSLLNSNTFAEAKGFINNIYSQIAPYAASCP